MQDPGLDVLVEERPAHHVAERQLSGFLDRVVGDPELGAELGPGPRLVDRPEHPLPKSAANGKDRVVLGEEPTITGGQADIGAGEMALDLPHVRVEEPLEIV